MASSPSSSALTILSKLFFFFFQDERIFHSHCTTVLYNQASCSSSFIMMNAWCNRSLNNEPCVVSFHGYVLCLITQSCLTLCDAMTVTCQALLSTGILQARILEWVAIPSSRGSSQTRDWTQVSCVAGRFFTIWATRFDIFLFCTYLWCERWEILSLFFHPAPWDKEEGL